MMIAIMVVLPIILMLLGLPIFTVLFAAASLALIYILELPIGLIQTELFGSVDNYNLIAVPFFIFAGAIMTQGGMSGRLVNWVLSLLGGLRGSLGLTTVGACTLFGAISGSSPATVAAIGGMLYPSLREKGYPESTASGLLTSSGAIAGIIPPSIGMILYGVAAEELIRYLFIGGILPGLMIAFMMGLYIYFVALRHGIREGGQFSVAQVGKTTVQGGWALGMPAIILGGIYSGVFSPTEAAGVACLYSMFVAIVIYRDLTFAGLWKVAVEFGDPDGAGADHRRCRHSLLAVAYDCRRATSAGGLDPGAGVFTVRGDDGDQPAAAGGRMRARSGVGRAGAGADPEAGRGGGWCRPGALRRDHDCEPGNRHVHAAVRAQYFRDTGDVQGATSHSL